MTVPKPISLTEAYALRRHVADLQARLREQDTVIADLNASIAGFHAEAQVLHGALHSIQTSFSWRVSAPVRVAGRLTRTFLRQLKLSQYQVAPMAKITSAAPCSSPDPNDPLIYRPAPVSDDGKSIITLDVLYHLSRSL